MASLTDYQNEMKNAADVTQGAKDNREAITAWGALEFHNDRAYTKGNNLTEVNMLLTYYNIIQSSSARTTGIDTCNAIIKVLSRIYPAVTVISQSGTKLEGDLNIKDVTAANVDLDAIETYFATITRSLSKALGYAKGLPDIQYEAQ